MNSYDIMTSDVFLKDRKSWGLVKGELLHTLVFLNVKVELRDLVSHLIDLLLQILGLSLHGCNLLIVFLHLSKRLPWLRTSDQSSLLCLPSPLKTVTVVTPI